MPIPTFILAATSQPIDDDELSLISETMDETHLDCCPDTPTGTMEEMSQRTNICGQSRWDSLSCSRHSPASPFKDRIFRRRLSNSSRGLSNLPRSSAKSAVDYRKTVLSANHSNHTLKSYKSMNTEDSHNRAGVASTASSRTRYSINTPPQRPRRNKSLRSTASPVRA